MNKHLPSVACVATLATITCAGRAYSAPQSVQTIEIGQPRFTEFVYENGDTYSPGQVIDMVALPSKDGFLVADKSLKHLVFLDISSFTARDIGRYGQGPGEYLIPSAVRAEPLGEEIYVLDEGNLRLQILDGKLLPIRTSLLPFSKLMSLDIVRKGVLLLAPTGASKLTTTGTLRGSAFYLYDLSSSSLADSASTPHDVIDPMDVSPVALAERLCFARVVGGDLVVAAYVDRRLLEVYRLDGTFVSSMVLVFDEEDLDTRRVSRMDEGVLKVPAIVKDMEAHPTEHRVIFYVRDRQNASSYIFYSVDVPDGRRIIRYVSPYDSDGDRILREMFQVNKVGSRDLVDFAINSKGQILAVEAYTLRLLFWVDGISGMNQP
jgi:hypothetical protein